MKTKVFLSIVALTIVFFPFTLRGQVRVTTERMDHSELSDFFRFEGIQYKVIVFSGKELKDKTFQLSAKEIWDGVVTKDSIIVDSKTLFAGMVPDYFKTVGDTVFKIRVISKLTEENKLKMQFNFPRFSTTKEFDATSSKSYSLRDALGAENEMVFEYGKNFYVMVYMLPYEKDGMGYYCAVEVSGKEIETWGKEFGIKHYLVFEMKFEPL